MEISSFVSKVPGLVEMPTKDKVLVFGWYLHRVAKMDVFPPKAVQSLFDDASVARPDSLGSYFKQLTTAKKLIVKKSLYRLERQVLDAFDLRYSSLIQQHKLDVRDEVIPTSITAATRPFIEAMARQINGSYQTEMFDCTAVMMRRLMESLLIECYVFSKTETAIKNGKDFKMLADIVATTRSGLHVRLSRGSDKILDDVKDVGDRAAHHRHYTTKKQDIDGISARFRALLVELLNASNIKSA